MIAIAFIVAAVIGVWRAVAARVRRRSLVDHEPRALKLLDAPHISPCLACGSDDDLCRTMRDTPAGYFSFCRPKNTGRAPVKLPIAGPGTSVRR